MPLTTEQKETLTAALKILRSDDSFYGGESVCDVLANLLIREHRTHQQTIVKNLHHALVRYATAGYDARNEASVEWAKKATKEPTVFPYI